MRDNEKNLKFAKKSDTLDITGKGGPAAVLVNSYGRDGERLQLKDGNVYYQAEKSFGRWHYFVLNTIP